MRAIAGLTGENRPSGVDWKIPSTAFSKTERKWPRTVESVDIDRPNQLVRDLLRDRNGRTNLGVRPERTKSFVVDCAVEDQRHALAHDPTRDAFIQRHALTEQALSILSAHGGDIQLIAVGDRQQDRY